MKLKSVEAERVYIYENGFKLIIKEVTEVSVSPSGNHRLETLSGKKYVIAPKWIAIELDVESWTF